MPVTGGSFSNIVPYYGIGTKQRLAADALSLSRPNDVRPSLPKRTAVPPRSPVRMGSTTQMVLGFKKKIVLPQPTLPEATTTPRPEDDWMDIDELVNNFAGIAHTDLLLCSFSEMQTNETDHFLHEIMPSVCVVNLSAASPAHQLTLDSQICSPILARPGFRTMVMVRSHTRQVWSFRGAVYRQMLRCN